MPIYMKIQGIEGESHSEEYRNWFDVFSFSWGETNPASTGGGGGGGAGRVNMADFAIMKRASKGSPALFLACATGRHFSRADIVVTRFASEEEQVFEHFVLSDVLITRYDISGDAGDIPTDGCSINFRKIEFTQMYQGPDGQLFSQTNWFDQRNGRGG